MKETYIAPKNQNQCLSPVCLFKTLGFYPSLNMCVVALVVKVPSFSV